MQKRQTAENVQTSLRGIANRAGRDQKHRFGHLYTMLNEEMLESCYWELNRKSSVGVDGESWREYGKDLKQRIADLVQRLKAGQYRARMVRRSYIPKGNGKKRPLGIPVTEDKLLQLAAAKILEAIHEGMFRNSSWGYRPKRDARTASRVLGGWLYAGRYNWVVEADIRGYFEHIDHDWLIRMLELRVNDRAFLRLIRKWLKAGVLEADGKILHPATGTPQGGVISPILANVYLHYVLDLWFERVVWKKVRGQAVLMRYADDFITAFEKEEEAEAFLGWLKERLKKFGLELAEEKTRKIRFSKEMKQNGAFEFLGFEYRWHISRKGKAHVRRRTAPTRLRKAVAAFSMWIKENRHLGTGALLWQLRPKLMGYWNYYGVRGNFASLNKFWCEVRRRLFKWLNRRSQRHSYNWEGFQQLLNALQVPGPRITEAL
jgi:group II intron reverse transcriptase/maturase